MKTVQVGLKILHALDSPSSITWQQTPRSFILVDWLLIGFSKVTHFRWPPSVMRSDFKSNKTTITDLQDLQIKIIVFLIKKSIFAITFCHLRNHEISSFLNFFRLYQLPKVGALELGGFIRIFSASLRAAESGQMLFRAV